MLSEKGIKTLCTKCPYFDIDSSGGRRMDTVYCKCFCGVVQIATFQYRRKPTPSGNYFFHGNAMVRNKLQKYIPNKEVIHKPDFEPPLICPYSLEHVLLAKKRKTENV